MLKQILNTIEIIITSIRDRIAYHQKTKQSEWE